MHLLGAKSSLTHIIVDKHYFVEDLSSKSTPMMQGELYTPMAQENRKIGLRHALLSRCVPLNSETLTRKEYANSDVAVYQKQQTLSKTTR